MKLFHVKVSEHRQAGAEEGRDGKRPGGDAT
jgi:hypothetical protein